MASGSYFTGLTAQPKLYENIYYQKQAKADAAEAARQKEQSDKYAKDADKFRIDYSKIHRIYAPKAKGAVAEFMSTADELKQKYPHTYANTEDYNNAYFKATSEIEDLQNYSKNIYGALETRAKDAENKFETDPETMKILTSGSLEDWRKLKQRENVEMDDILQTRFDPKETLSDIFTLTAKDEVYKKNAQGEVATAPYGSGTDDVIATIETIFNSDQLEKNTLDAWNNNSAFKRKYDTPEKAIEFVKANVAQGKKEVVNAKYHAPVGSGAGQAIQTSLTNQGQGHKLTFGFNNNGQVQNMTTTASQRLSVVPTNVTISASPDMYNKSTGEKIGSSGQQNISVGEIAVVPVYKNYGDKFNGRVVDDNVLSSTQDKGKYFEYKVVYTGEADGKTSASKKTPVYGDISQVETALFSKESPITDKAAFSKTLEEMKAEAKKLNEGLSKKQSTQKKFSQMTASEKQAIVNTIPQDIKSQGNAAVSTWLKGNGY